MHFSLPLLHPLLTQGKEVRPERDPLTNPNYMINSGFASESLPL